MRLAGKVLAFFGSAIVALVVAVVLAGISQSGVVNMQMTHTLFWIAFGISAVAMGLGVWLISQSFKDALLALLLTAIIVGGGLWRLDSWLTVKKAEQDATTQPPPLHTTAAPPPVSITRTSIPAKPQQDNSVHIGKGAFLVQKSTGNCSPNIIGGSSTVNCGPPAQKSGVELNVSLVDPTAPSIVIDNQTDSLAEGIIWELVMFRTTDQGMLSYTTQSIGYLKPHSKSPRESMELTSRQAFGGGGQVKTGESFIGTLSIDCPLCRGTTLIVSFVWGSSGWFYKVPDGDGRLILPKDISKDTISRFLDRINTVISPELRIPIS